LDFSLSFFPIKGILAVYDREDGTYRPLSGADDPEYVQTNPCWSPDGKTIVFARAKASDLKADTKNFFLSPTKSQEYLDTSDGLHYDLYRVPFNDGAGGVAEPVKGASNNGMSNYFAKYSPDGRWIVYCQAKSFMFLQPDSKLHIIPAEGGESQRMLCNTPRMNSWHSWSPNSKWLVFASKPHSPFTQLFLTHIDDQGRSSPAVALTHMSAANWAANIPEFVNGGPNAIKNIVAKLDSPAFASLERLLQIMFSLLAGITLSASAAKAKRGWILKISLFAVGVFLEVWFTMLLLVTTVFRGKLQISLAVSLAVIAAISFVAYKILRLLAKDPVVSTPGKAVLTAD
jgi:hypothetical protein